MGPFENGAFSDQSLDFLCHRITDMRSHVRSYDHLYSSYDPFMNNTFDLATLDNLIKLTLFSLPFCQLSAKDLEILL
jgi:hypothetical protein